MLCAVVALLFRDFPLEGASKYCSYCNLPTFSSREAFFQPGLGFKILALSFGVTELYIVA